MRVKSIEVNLGTKIYLGDFESVTVGAGIQIDLEDGDDPKDVYSYAWKTVRGELSGRVIQVRKRMKEKKG
jgi:hypothetical protein